jgi:KUP system potassium uptake protein
MPPAPSRSSVATPEATPSGEPDTEQSALPNGEPGQHEGHGHPPANPVGKRLAILTLTALGVVYGDIGTSPLYTMRETFSAEYGMVPNPANVYGILCLVFWALMLVVVFKYLVFILRADNRGEGGVLAMLALLLQNQQRAEDRRRRAILIILGVFGTALLFGDGVITPAISVLGAVEGLEIATPGLQPFVVGITVIILFVLFVFQKHGTSRVGKAFGPVTLIWFLTIGALGAVEIARAPQILSAMNPAYAVTFLGEHRFAGFAVLGAVFLAVTGAEALYADIGHFGIKPIRLAFFTLVLPALLLNYFGQGAVLLRNPAAVDNPFYLLAPRWFLYPLLIIATLAAIVASQALISGAFSLAQQSIQLGYSPRLTIVHTSQREHGQIYVPEVNKALMVGTLVIVLGFRSSDALGAAYGIAVTGTMAITTMLFAVVARTKWNWPLWQVVLLASCFFVFDFAFLGANALKIQQGGWVPLAIALSILTLMTTWKRGRAILAEIMLRSSMPLDLLLADIGRKRVHRVPGTAVFLTSVTDGAPVVLLHHLKHNKVLHQQVVLLSIVSADVPEVEDSERLQVIPLEHGFFRVTAEYGFMETPNVPRVLAMSERFGLRARPGDTSYFLGRERLIATGRSPMVRWRKKLFSFLSRNARSATEFFGIPPNRVVELGAQIEF